MKKFLHKLVIGVFFPSLLMLTPFVNFGQSFQSANVGPNRFITYGESTLIGAPAITGHTYLWSPADALSSETDAQPEAWPAVTTTFYLTETEVSTNIQFTDSVVVTVRPYPYAITGDDTIICYGQKVTFGGAPNPGNTYSWTPANGLSSTTSSQVTAQPTSTVTYYLTETDTLTQYSNSNTITIEVIQPPAVDAGNDKTFCMGGNTTIGTSSVAGVSYNWTPNADITDATIAEPTANPAFTTTYTLTVTDSITGCTNSDATVITVNPIPDANVGTDQTICLNNSVTIGAPGVSGNTYQWTANNNLTSDTIANPSVSPQETTTYHLTEINPASGCLNSNEVTVTVNPIPAAITGPDKTICFGEGVLIGVAPVPGNTYSWDPAKGLNNNGLSQPFASPKITTVYFLTETITATGCENTNPLVLTVNPLPKANTGTDLTLCSGLNSIIGNDPVNGNTYNWIPVNGLSSATVSNPTVNVPMTTTYTLTETNTTTGCVNSNKVTVTVIPKLNTPTDPTGETDFCQYNTESIYGTTAIEGATSYVWTILPTNAGTIINNGISSIVEWNDNFYGPATITVAGQNSCGTGTLSNSLDVNVKVAPPTPTISLNKGKLTSSAITGNQWFSESGPVSGANKQVFKPSLKGTYYVRVTGNDCGSKPSNGILVVPSLGDPNSINSDNISAQVQIYPNPNSGTFTVLMPDLNNEPFDLTISNSIGKTVYQRNQLIADANTGLQINLQDLEQGVYLLNIHSLKADKIARIIIRK